MRFFWILCLWFFTFAQAANLQDVVPLKKWQGEEWVNSETTKFSADARFAAGLDHGTVIVIDLEKRKKVFRVGEMTQEVNSQLSDTIQWFGFSPKKATEHEWFVVQS